MIMKFTAICLFILCNNLPQTLNLKWQTFIFLHIFWRSETEEVLVVLIQGF